MVPTLAAGAAQSGEQWLVIRGFELDVTEIGLWWAYAETDGLHHRPLIGGASVFVASGGGRRETSIRAVRADWSIRLSSSVPAVGQ